MGAYLVTYYYEAATLIPRNVLHSWVLTRESVWILWITVKVLANLHQSTCN